MSLSVSRMAGASSISTVLCSLNSTSYAFNPKSNALFVKSKDATLCNVHGFISRNLQYDPMLTISRKNFVVRSNITPPPGVPLPSGPPSGSMIIYDSVDKVDTVVNTAEYVVETLESVATKVDNVIDRITDDLPEDSKLRKSMVALDELVEGVAKAAHIANDIIDKVEEVEDKLESLILEEAKEEVSKVAVERDVIPSEVVIRQRFWSTIENDVFEAVKYFFNSGAIPNGCNSSFIALIPKIPDANLVKDFRPISLIESMYKIIAKIMANRLVGVLGDIVNEVQSLLIAGKSTNHDGPFILNEVLQWCKLKKKQSLIFKVDFEKAFDSLPMISLEDDILKKIGFGDKWVAH
ncbi:RNA-directed DNA polymerase, eukaryota, reverse transcriptase zinc-binding domain protein [Tanacetum coccineum]